MLQHERIEDIISTLELVMNARLGRVWTAMPGIVQAFNAQELTCDVQVAINGSKRDKDGTVSDIQISKLLDCPVHFPGGGGVVLTFPIAVGDEVLVVFASRGIDPWWQSGGIQKQFVMSMHDLSDGFVIPKVWSRPKAADIASVSSSAAQLRTEDGSVFFEVGPSGIKMKGEVQIVNGSLKVDKDVISNVTTPPGSPPAAPAVQQGSHVHADPQGGNTAPPTPGT